MERLFVTSKTWAEILDITCTQTFGHGLKEFLSKFNGGEYYIWPGGHEACEEIWAVYRLCPQSWFKPELRIEDKDLNHWTSYACYEPAEPSCVYPSQRAIEAAGGFDDKPTKAEYEAAIRRKLDDQVN